MTYSLPPFSNGTPKWIMSRSFAIHCDPLILCWRKSLQAILVVRSAHTMEAAIAPHQTNKSWLCFFLTTNLPGYRTPALVTPQWIYRLIIIAPNMAASIVSSINAWLQRVTGRRMFFSTVNLALSQPTSLSELWDKMIPPSVGRLCNVCVWEQNTVQPIGGLRVWTVQRRWHTASNDYDALYNCRGSLVLILHCILLLSIY